MGSLPGRVAIAHDYLTQRGGAERVVLSLAKAFPGAPIHTTLYDPEGTYPEFRDLDVRPSWLDRVGPLRRNHRAALPLLPLASSSIDIDADLVVASTSGWAHGFRTRGRVLVYCHAPARWLYQPDVYLGEAPPRGVRTALRVLSPGLRRWDARAAARADHYLANSTVVRDRIQEAYGVRADLLPAPVVSAFAEVDAEPVTDADGRELEPGFVLCVSRLLPYKNVDRIVEALRARPQLRLAVVGSGPERDRLVAAAPGNVVFLEELTDGQMRWLYERCVGLVAASHEDFGLTPIEALSFGRPCAVLRAGGFLDTMTDDTAVFFDAAEPDVIAAALDELVARDWDLAKLAARADVFAEATYVREIRAAAARVLGVSPPG